MRTPTYCRNQLWESIGWLRNGANSSRNRAQHAFPAPRPECTYIAETTFKSPFAKCWMLKNCHSQWNRIMQDGISQCAISFHGPWQTPLARSPLCDAGVGGFNGVTPKSIFFAGLLTLFDWGAWIEGLFLLLAFFLMLSESSHILF